MKQYANPNLKTLLCSILVSLAATLVATAESGHHEREDQDRPHDDSHFVAGYGVVHVPVDFFGPGSVSFYESYTVSARRQPDGTVKGTVVVQAWSETDAATRTTTVIDVDCLTITGGTAYWGGVVRWTDEPFAFVGMEALGFVTDSRRAAPDLTWFGPAFIFVQPGQDCSSHPTMPQMPIVSGNYIVR
jgi:hypothetical protein